MVADNAGPSSRATAEDSPSSRVARRRAARRQRLLAIAAHKFAEQGLGARLEDIADEADVARGTLYSHFPTKEALVTAIVRPALERAADEVANLAQLSAREAVAGLLRLYVSLWRDHGEALRVAYRLRDMPLGELGPVHGRFMTGMLAALGKAADAGVLRSPSPRLAAQVLASVAVPLLELYDTVPDGDRLFVQSLRGLLLEDA